MNKLLFKQNEIPHGTTIDGEGDKAAMRSPIEKDESGNHNTNEELPEKGYGNSTAEEDVHPERNPGVGQIGNAR